jgi:hypothetical protein
MSGKRYFIIVAILLMFNGQELLAKGAKVIVHLKNSQQQSGELYAINDSLLTLYKGKKDDQPMLTEVRTNELAKVVIKDDVQIFLALQNGEQFVANYKSISDSSLSVYRKKKLREVKIADVKKAMIKLKGRSGTATGIGVGLLTFAVAFPRFFDNGFHADNFAEGFMEVMMSPLAAAGTGVAIGGVVSSAISSPEQEYEMAVASFVAFLQPLARQGK